MCKMVGVLFFLGLAAVYGRPAKDELMFDLGGDTAVVESTVREARQAPEHIEQLLKPGVKNAFIHTYGDKKGDKGDIHGYSKKLNDEGNDGYRHYDSFHKKDADKYGYEVHSEYGKANKAKYDSTDKNGKYKKGRGKGRGEAQESRTLYRVSEEPREDDKNRQALDDFDFVYFGGGKGSGKYEGGGGENESNGGKSGKYETNESYSSGGSSSYDSGDKGGSGAYSEGRSQSLAAEDDDGESAGYAEEEEEEDDY